MGTANWNALHTVSDAIEVLRCEDIERLVQALYLCQFRLSLLEAAQIDNGFDLILVRIKPGP